MMAMAEWMGPLLVESALKATLLLGGTLLIALAMRGRSAAERHLVWAIGLTGALALPAVAVLLPGVQVPVLPASAPADASPLAAPTALDSDSSAI